MRIVKPISIADANLVSSTVPENDQPVYTSGNGYSLRDKVMVLSNHTIYECIKQEILTVTFSGNTVQWKAHGLVNGRMVRFSVVGGSLPTGISAGSTYYVVNSTQDAFSVSSTPNGSAIALTGAGSGTMTCTALVNSIDPVTNPTYWLNSGSTNRWKMFDKTVQSQTTATSEFTTVVNAADFVDTIALLNVTATEVEIKITHGDDGVVYQNKVLLAEDDDPVIDWWSYFFSGFKIKSDVIIEGIPPYANTQITITVRGISGTTVGAGAVILGSARDISSERKGVEQGARIGITDYSIKTRDAFGNYIITERAFSKRANYTVYVKREEVDAVLNLLASIRATPTLFIGTKTYASTAIYGFYKSFDIDIAYPDVSICTIEIDGLT